MGFMEVSIEGEKVFGGLAFPMTLLPPSSLDSPNTLDLVELVKQQRVRIDEALNRNGAVLIRGFGVDSAHHFSQVVAALGWGEFPYHGAAQRETLADRVYSANESPPQIFINFHHEMALIKEFPSKILFCCVEPSPKGGETSIVRSDVVVEKMEEEMPHVVDKLERVGMKFVLRRAPKVWQRLVGTKDHMEAQKRALESLVCNSVEFNEDGSADFSYGPMNPIREKDGRRVWFNTIVGSVVTDHPELNATFGDGSSIPSDAITAYQTILEENCVDVRWGKGDVLLVNNLMVQHARRSGEPPRVILVSLCK